MNARSQVSALPEACKKVLSPPWPRGLKLMRQLLKIWLLGTKRLHPS